jgi:tetratricopeptide (TPR) repeat protein
MSSENQLTKAIAEQYGAALKMLENTIKECDEGLWQDSKTDTVISQVVYHTLYYVDYYLSKNKAEKESFKGKYGRDGGSFHEPDKIFTKGQLTNYLQEIMEKADKRFNNITIQELVNKPVFEGQGSSLLSSLLYDLRHIMLHVGALHVRVNAQEKKPLRWISTYPEEEGEEKNDLAFWNLQNGNLPEAEKLYKELCTNSENSLFYYNLACCYARQGKVEQTIETLKTCLKYDNGRFKELAKNDVDFANVRDKTEFSQLLSN